MIQGTVAALDYYGFGAGKIGNRPGDIGDLDFGIHFFQPRNTLCLARSGVSACNFIDQNDALSHTYIILTMR